MDFNCKAFNSVSKLFAYCGERLHAPTTPGGGRFIEDKSFPLQVQDGIEHPVFIRIVHTREIQVMWSQTVTMRNQKQKVTSVPKTGGLPIGD